MVPVADLPAGVTVSQPFLGGPIVVVDERRGRAVWEVAMDSSNLQIVASSPTGRVEVLRGRLDLAELLGTDIADAVIGMLGNAVMRVTPP